jgi:hypothetical protein
MEDIFACILGIFKEPGKELPFALALHRECLVKDRHYPQGDRPLGAPPFPSILESVISAGVGIVRSSQIKRFPASAGREDGDGFCDLSPMGVFRLCLRWPLVRNRLRNSFYAVDKGGNIGPSPKNYSVGKGDLYSLQPRSRLGNEGK